MICFAWNLAKLNKDWNTHAIQYHGNKLFNFSDIYDEHNAERTAKFKIVQNSVAYWADDHKLFSRWQVIYSYVNNDDVEVFTEYINNASDRSAAKKTDDGYQGKGCPCSTWSGLILCAVDVTFTACSSWKVGKIHVKFSILWRVVKDLCKLGKNI